MPTKPTTDSKRGSKNKKNVSKPDGPPKVTADANSASGLDSEVEDRFELELCWCIQQLETSLASCKLQEKQMYNLSKHIHSLKSNTAPLIKKRQIMRNVLGDYREKMAKDERKFNRIVSTVKFANTVAPKKSVFIKKATQHNVQELQQSTDDHRTQDTLVSTKHAIIDTKNHLEPLRTPFLFNFQPCQ